MEQNMQSFPPELNFNKTLEVIKASAGCGKTTALINKFLQSVENYREQNKHFPKIVISTFTRKATRELKERLMIQAIELKDKELIHYISYSPLLQISTLHGVFHNFLQLHGHHIQLSPGFEIMDEQESYHLFDTVLKKQLLRNQLGVDLLKHYHFYEIRSLILDYLKHNQYSPTSHSATMDELQEALQKKIQLKQKTNKKQEELNLLQDEKHLLSEFVSVSTELKNLANTVLHSLTQKKKKLARVTFNDLELMTLEVLKKQAMKHSIADFWFLDEYQDTSHTQDEILNHLTKNSQVFIVGDPQQSIYYFRGANSSVFLKKARRKSKQLNHNYRSSPELIDFFNKFFPRNPAFAKIFEPMHSKKENSSPLKEYIKFIPHTDHIKQETNQRIKQLLSTGAETKNIVILSKKNKTLIEWAQYLKKEQWPVQLHSSGNFKHKREIKDAVFLLKFLLNPHNDENLIGLLRTPYCRIPDHTLMDWMNKKDEKTSLWSFCHKIENNILHQLINFLKQSKSEGVVYTFQNALESLGILDLAHYEDPTGLREANLWKMIYYLRDYELKGSSSLLNFINKFLDFQPSQPSQSQRSDSPSALPVTESSSLQLMTIHQSKGLEFEHVILLDDFPPSAKSGHGTTDFFTAHRESGKWAVSIRTKQADKRIKSQYHQQILEWNNEELSNEMNRLIYVALTRAKKSITVVHLTKNSFFSKNFCRTDS